MLFFEKPTTFEVDHWQFFEASKEYVAEHHELPETRAWDRLLFRRKLNPERFEHFHPNLEALIELAHQDGPGRPDFWPIDRCSPYQADCGCEQPPSRGAQHVVPEPPGLALALVAAIVWMGVMWRKAR